MRINTNIPALQSYNALTITNDALAKSISKLSTGLRINSAADDAAGLAISEKMRAQYRGLDQATTNAQDGISMIQTAEGALNETHSILQRMRELSVQAANDTLTQEDRSFIQLEIDQLKEEIDRISTTTQFNKKQLLDGSAAVVWSSDDLATRAIINGGLRQIDQFGQKRSLEGNYKITIKATPGEAEIQKSDVLRIKHPNLVTNAVLNANAGFRSVSVDGMPAGTYSVDASGANGIHGTPSQSYIQKRGFGFTDLLVISGGALDVNIAENQSIMFETLNVNTAAGSATFRVSIKALTHDGVARTYSESNMVISTTGTSGTYEHLGWNDKGALDPTKIKLGAQAMAGLSVGDKFVYSVCADDGTNGSGENIDVDVHLDFNCTVSTAWSEGWMDPAGTAPGTFNRIWHVNSDLVKGKEVRFEQYILNANNGTVHEGATIIRFDNDNNIQTGTRRASFQTTYVGEIAQSDTKLRDIDKFWDANGKFMLEDPKTLTLSQGDGKKTTVTLYSTDTIADVRKKLNDAIASGLGQGKYAKNATSQFVTYVEEHEGVPSTPESVNGTMIIRSLIPGAAGRISLSGDEDIIKAFSLNVIQEARETQYEANIVDAHSGNVVESGIKVTGNKLVGAIDSNLDIVFDNMANIDVEYNTNTKKFAFKQSANKYETILHLADNTTVFQIGANEGEDMGVNIGSMSAEALGLSSLIVTDRESAARSITKIDAAIGKVSMQRARLGAYQNRLEHTTNNLTTASTNLKSSESRIRDVDMAKEMMEFTKLNILSQAGNSMLAQANQLPQNVLSLLK